MKKVIIISIFIVCLFIVEAILIYSFSLVESVLRDGGLVFKSDDFRFLTGTTFMRVVFYFVPQLIVFYFLLEMAMGKGIGWISSLNVLTFVIISTLILGIWTNDLGEYIKRPVFYYFIFATAISPIVLNFLPFFKKLADKI